MEFVAVAMDTAGAELVEQWFHPDELTIASEQLRRRRGWRQEVWRRQSFPTYTCLIDSSHALADLYGMTNVPLAVWIDEDGWILRPPEPAGVGDEWREQDPATGELPAEAGDRAMARRDRYLHALEDWVLKGAQSDFALSPSEVRAQLPRTNEDDVRAASQVQLGCFLFEQGSAEAAEQHFALAAKLTPTKWSYRRQSMVLSPETLGQLNRSPEFWQAMAELGDDRSYPEIDMSGMP